MQPLAGGQDLDIAGSRTACHGSKQELGNTAHAVTGWQPESLHCWVTYGSSRNLGTLHMLPLAGGQELSIADLLTAFHGSRQELANNSHAATG